MKTLTPLSFFIFLFLSNITVSNAQQRKNFIIPDSLNKMSFEALEKRFDNSLLNNEKRSIYANAYYKKSKKQTNNIILANGMYMKAFLFTKEKETLKYIDSIIELTKNSDDFKYPAKAYILKSNLFYTNDKLNDALVNILIAEEYSKKTNNIEQNILIKQQIGLIKVELGKPLEALPLILENYNYNKLRKSNSPYYIYSAWILSDIYNRLKKPDSALFYINSFLKKLNPKNPYYKYFLLNKGISYHLKKDYVRSSFFLDKSTALIEQKNDPLNLGMGYYYRGENELGIGNNIDKAKYYFNKVDLILVKSKKYSLDLRDNYIRLIEISKKQKDDKQQLYYLNRLIEIDNYLTKNNVILSENVTKNYDTPHLLIEKDDIIDKINREKYIYIGIGFIVMIGFGFSIFYLIKSKEEKRLLEGRFNRLIQTPIAENIQKLEETIPRINIESEETTPKTIDLPKEIADEILKKLSIFEKNKDYLNPNIKQIDFAKQLNTNSSYLSKVINHYKDKNFSQYINDLRIDYTITKLKEDKKFRKYTIKSVAEEVGFNNAESFAKAFYNKTGLQPSYFIKKIEEKNKEELVSIV